MPYQEIDMSTKAENLQSRCPRCKETQSSILGKRKSGREGGNVVAVHINDLFVSRFRGIESLRLNELNGINILTGDNNCGKTSVLELLSTLDGPDSFLVWASCGRLSTRPFSRRMYYESFYSLFPIDSQEKQVLYEVHDAYGVSHQVMLTADIYDTQVSEADIDYINYGSRLGKGDESNQLQNHDAKCMELRAYVDGKQTELGDLYDFQYSVNRRYRRGGADGIVSTLLVAPFSHAYGAIRMDEVLSNSDLYEEFLEVLRVFDNQIIGINAASSTSSGLRPDYQILTKSHKEALPLSAYGDGMKKAILLCADAVSAKNGLLLLDEFETAIHTSAMRRVFRAFLRTAMRMNVQVFMTSHSKEAIEKVLGLDGDIQEQVNLYTLYKHDGRSLVRKMSCAEALEASGSLGVELR